MEGRLLNVRGATKSELTFQPLQTFMPHWGLERGAGAAASGLLRLHSNILSCAKNNARTLNFSVSRLQSTSQAGVAPLSDGKEEAWRGLWFTEIPWCRQWWILACPSVLCCLLQLVYRSCVSFGNKLGVNVQDLSPLVVSLEKCLSSSFRGKRGEKKHTNVQLSLFSCAWDSDPVGKSFFTFLKFIFYSPDRCEWKAYCLLAFQEGTASPFQPETAGSESEALQE